MTTTPIVDDAVPVEVRELLPLMVNPLTPSTIKTASGLSLAISWTQSPAENPYQLAETFAAFLVRAVNDYALRPASPPRAADAAEVERDWPRLADAEVRLERMIEENVTLRRNFVHERARALKAEEKAESNEGWAMFEQDRRHDAERNLEAALAAHPAPDIDKRAAEDAIDALYAEAGAQMARAAGGEDWETVADAFSWLRAQGAMLPADRRAAREASKAEEGR